MPSLFSASFSPNFSASPSSLSNSLTMTSVSLRPSLRPSHGAGSADRHGSYPEPATYSLKPDPILTLRHRLRSISSTADTECQMRLGLWLGGAPRAFRRAPPNPTAAESDGHNN